MPIKGWRYTPNTTFATGSLLDLFQVILFYTIGRVCHQGMETLLRNTTQPLKAIRMDNKRISDGSSWIIEFERLGEIDLTHISAHFHTLSSLPADDSC